MNYVAAAVLPVPSLAIFILCTYMDDAHVREPPFTSQAGWNDVILVVYVNDTRVLLRLVSTQSAQSRRNVCIILLPLPGRAQCSRGAAHNLTPNHMA